MAMQYTVTRDRYHNIRLMVQTRTDKVHCPMPSHRFRQKLADSDITQEADNNVFAMVNLKVFVHSSRSICSKVHQVDDN